MDASPVSPTDCHRKGGKKRGDPNDYHFSFASFTPLREGEIGNEEKKRKKKDPVFFFFSLLSFIVASVCCQSQYYQNMQMRFLSTGTKGWNEARAEKIRQVLSNGFSFPKLEFPPLFNENS